MYRSVLLPALTIAGAALAACGTETTGTSSAAPASNSAPVVALGADVETPEGGQIQLSATVTDLDNDAVLSWSQMSGPAGTLSTSSSASPVFTAPIVNAQSVVVLRLTADDGIHTPSFDEMMITINNTARRSPSPQGIDGDIDDRRARARDGRAIERPRADREIRTFDGSNNNVANPLWGTTFAHLQRLAPADYSDGISALSGVLRPSARVVSNGVIDQNEGEVITNAYGGTDFIWQWGQFIDHDLDLTDGAAEQADIPIPTGDPQFDPDSTGTQVIFFNRALFDRDTGRDASTPREQENEISSWLDGSMIYGSDDARAAALRVGPDSPFLKTSDGNLLPFNVDNLTNANGPASDPATLFLAGDVRANEQLGLAVMHTLFVREHNRLAQTLQENFPLHDGEMIFQRARRLVVAKLQMITYQEFLPALVGPGALPAYSGYDPSINPTIFNEFSVAAYRLGHSMLNERLLRVDASGQEIPDGHLQLRDAFFRTPLLLRVEDDLDPILRGLAAQQHQALDVKVVADLRNFLFGRPGAGGLDLPSLNIQRGRDHGVPSYNDMREAMGLARAATFSDITSDVDMAQRLSDTYGNVDLIDLWVGGLAEDPLVEQGSQLGELFQAIIVKQFADLRDGDRFWYQNDLRRGDLARIAGTTLAGVIRANTSIGDELQDNVFAAP